MEIIVVEGKSNVGKSTTIKEVVKDLIVNKHFSVKWMNYAWKGQNPADVIEHRWYTKNHNVSDIRILLEKNGKNLCIVSVGDAANQVVDAYNRTVRHLDGGMCDLFVCACHPHSPARKMLDEWAKPSEAQVVVKTSIQQNVQNELKEKILQVMSYNKEGIK